MKRPRKPVRLGRRARFGVVLAMILLPATLVIGSIALDRAGYCVAFFLPGNSQLETGPYLQNVSETTASLVWRTIDDDPGTIDYRRSGVQQWTTVATPADKQHIARLSGLQAGTKYDYRVSLRLETVAGSFWTAPEASETVVIGVIGDSGVASDAQFAVAEQLEQANPDILLHTGDVVYRRGALCHYLRKYFDPYGELIRSVPVFPAIGNHDYLADDGAAYFELFDLPANNPSESEAYYSFDYGSAHFVALDSEAWERAKSEEVDAQMAWLESDLAAATATWTVVYFHRPIHTTKDDKHADESLMNEVTPLLEQFGVDLVLSGHVHGYERFAPLNEVTYIVTGGGGADLVEVDDGAEVAIAAHHFVRLTIDPGLLRIEAIDRDGLVIDRHELLPAQAEN